MRIVYNTSLSNIYFTLESDEGATPELRTDVDREASDADKQRKICVII